jgi:hypothetical protein
VIKFCANAKDVIVVFPEGPPLAMAWNRGSLLCNKGDMYGKYVFSCLFILISTKFRPSRFDFQAILSC